MAIIAAYNLNNGTLTTDNSGGGYTLTNTGTVGEGKGIENGCAVGKSVFSSTDVKLSINSNLGNTSTTYSYIFWYSPTILASSGNEGILFGFSNASIGCRFQYSNAAYTGNVPALLLFAGGSSAVCVVPKTLVIGKWYQCGMYQTGGTASIIIDGIVKSSSSNTGTGMINQGFAILSDRHTGTFQCGPGRVDKSIILNSVPTASQIKNNYSFYKGFI